MVLVLILSSKCYDALPCRLSFVRRVLAVTFSLRCSASEAPFWVLWLGRASHQVAKWSFDAQEKARCKQERAHLEGRLEGLKILASVASASSHYNRTAYAVREFFFSTPKLFDDVQNADLFAKTLAGILRRRPAVRLS